MTEIPIPDFDILEDEYAKTDPLVKNSENLFFPHISTDELANMMGAEADKEYKLIIIDCRFDYEYIGGHIIGAKPLSQQLINNLFDERLKQRDDLALNTNDRAGVRSPQDEVKTKIVFHCEFSQNRGPTMAAVFRKMDRYFNRTCYPKLFFPEVMILRGGYRAFYIDHNDLCAGEYTKMKTKVHLVSYGVEKRRKIIQNLLNFEKTYKHHPDVVRPMRYSCSQPTFKFNEPHFSEFVIA